MGPRAWILVMLPSHALQIGISAVDLSADGRNCIGSSCDDGSCEFCALGWASRCVKCEQTCAGHPCMRMAVKPSGGSDGSTDDLPSSAGLCSDCEAAAQLFALVKGNDEWCCRSDGKPYSPLDSEECLRTLQTAAWQVHALLRRESQAWQAMQPTLMRLPHAQGWAMETCSHTRVPPSLLLRLAEARAATPEANRFLLFRACAPPRDGAQQPYHSMQQPRATDHVDSIRCSSHSARVHAVSRLMERCVVYRSRCLLLRCVVCVANRVFHVALAWPACRPQDCMLHAPSRLVPRAQPSCITRRLGSAHLCSE